MSDAAVPDLELRAAGDPRFVVGDDLAVARACITGASVEPGDAALTFVDFVDRHPDALHRSCAPGHLTGSAFVVDATGGRALLLFHTKLQRWLQPGGHADGEADLAAVALREAAEETGIVGLRVVVPAIDLDIHAVRPPGEPAHLHYDVRYLVVAPPGAVERLNHESQGAQWVTAGDFDSLGVDAGLRRLAARAFALAHRLST